MKREIWEQIVKFENINDYPKLPCPYCLEQSLVINKNEIKYKKSPCKPTSALIQQEVNENAQFIADIWKENVFLGVLAGVGVIATARPKVPAKFLSFFECESCNNIVSSTGTSQYPVSKIKKENENIFIKVEYFSPPIPIFEMSGNIPDDIRNEVLQSFNHFHSDLCSSGSKLRRSVEKLCANLGFIERNLHLSIESMKKKFPREANFLLALKLLGNEAVHSDNINEHDLLDAFEVQEFVLGIFDRLEAEKDIEGKAENLRLKFKK